MGNNRLKKTGIVVSCEHGGYEIPPSCRKFFTGERPVLRSHRGWDKGALELGRELAGALGVPLVASEISRLVVDLNRSLHHPDLFSEFTELCDAETKQNILNEFYLPYRINLDHRIKTAIKDQKSIIHYSIHSFTPMLDNKIRNTDIGLLYDPVRKTERMLCLRLQNLIQENSEWKVRRNYPYRGTADGFTTWLRKKYNDKQYCGIEIEVNQKIHSDKKKWGLLKRTIINAIRNSSGIMGHASRL